MSLFFMTEEFSVALLIHLLVGTLQVWRQQELRYALAGMPGDWKTAKSFLYNHFS